jgi:undecaprenyl diphosphate synthase
MDKSRIPRHVAIVMDGNGRWAQQRGKSKLFGHDAGMKAMKEIVKRSDQLGIQHLTMYAFSTENWKRSSDEVSGIFKLVVKYVNSELDELHDNNVIVDVIGDYTALPASAVAALERSFSKTKDNTGLHFHIALNYGSRDEILGSVRSLMEDAANGRISPDDLNEVLFSDRLYTGAVPDPDLVIRTSGEMRLSNFLLWQSAYSEFVFTEILWPDFTPAEFERCIEMYQNRERRFGGRV